MMKAGSKLILIRPFIFFTNTQLHSNRQGLKNILQGRRQSLQMSHKISVCLNKCLFVDNLGHL